jgi:hypothetical protein
MGGLISLCPEYDFALWTAVRLPANPLWSTAQTVEFLKARQVRRDQAVPRDAGHSLANASRSSVLCKPEKRQDNHDNHNESDDVDDVVHEFHLST